MNKIKILFYFDFDSHRKYRMVLGVLRTALVCCNSLWFICNRRALGLGRANYFPATMTKQRQTRDPKCLWRCVSAECLGQSTLYNFYPITDWLSCYSTCVFAGSVQQQFPITRYQSQGDVISAIQALSIVNTPGNDIAGAMRAIRMFCLDRGSRYFVQKVALNFVDQRASNRRELEAAHQVLNVHFNVSHIVLH